MNLTIFVAEELKSMGLFFELLPFFLILAAASPILCFFIMKKKGYDPIIGVLLGLFLNIIGLFICICIGIFTPTPKNNDSEYGQPYEPPYGQPPYGQPPYGQPYQPPYQPEMQQQGVRCNSCGMLNPPEAQHCIQCGEKLL